MNYPNNIKRDFKKVVNYANRGMDLENLINQMNEIYLEKDMAVIYKKPTPIQIVKYDYSKNKITDAYYKSPSTLDYNGIYKGYYIEFDAKKTTKNNLPLSNIAEHQIKHMRDIMRHNGIVFLLIMIVDKCFILSGEKVISFIETAERKSIPLSYIESNGIEVKYSYLRGVDYLPGVDELIKESCYEKA